MTQDDMIQIFKDTDALLEGHFELSSGLHSDAYCQCALVLQYPDRAEVLARELAKKVKELNITCVIGPALGGVTIAYEVGRALGVRAIFAERKNGEMQIRRGFSVADEDRILAVEDVITTGGSVKEVIALLRADRKNVVGVASIINRSSGDVDFGAPFASLVDLPLKKYEPETCPLCKAGSQAIKPGSRSKG